LIAPYVGVMAAAVCFRGGVGGEKLEHVRAYVRERDDCRGEVETWELLDRALIQDCWLVFSFCLGLISRHF
jgi:hypothetical protein